MQRFWWGTAAGRWRRHYSCFGYTAASRRKSRLTWAIRKSRLGQIVMKKHLALAGMAAVMAAGGDRAQACGDKLLSLSKGVLYQRAMRTSRPADILIYTAG